MKRTFCAIAVLAVGLFAAVSANQDLLTLQKDDNQWAIPAKNYSATRYSTWPRFMAVLPDQPGNAARAARTASRRSLRDPRAAFEAEALTPKALAGYWVDWEAGTSGFHDYAALSSPVTYLGKSVKRAPDVVNAVCDHPICPTWLTTRIYQHLTGGKTNKLIPAWARATRTSRAYDRASWP